MTPNNANQLLGVLRIITLGVAAVATFSQDTLHLAVLGIIIAMTFDSFVFKEN